MMEATTKAPPCSLCGGPTYWDATVSFGEEAWGWWCMNQCNTPDEDEIDVTEFRDDPEDD